MKSYEELEILAKKYALDKSLHTGYHNYIPSYAKIFRSIKHKVKHVLEIGIGSLENGQMGGLNGPLVLNHGYKTGNSLKLWSDFFEDAIIHGIDIFNHKELNTDKIKTYVADQGSQKDLQSVIDKVNSKLDIIIDDGSHQASHQVFSFEFLNQYLVSGGVYIIEDIQPPYIEKFKDLSIFSLSTQSHINDNFNIEHFDTRSQGKDDDFIIAFTRK